MVCVPVSGGGCCEEGHMPDMDHQGTELEGVTWSVPHLAPYHLFCVHSLF